MPNLNANSQDLILKKKKTKRLPTNFNNWPRRSSQGHRMSKDNSPGLQKSGKTHVT